MPCLSVDPLFEIRDLFPGLGGVLDTLHTQNIPAHLS